MKRHHELDRGGNKMHLVGAVWDDLGREDQQTALLVARQEGRQAVRNCLGVPGSEPYGIAALRNSPWAREHGDLAGLPDDVLHLYAVARTLPSDKDYVSHVVERFCPDSAPRWWDGEPEERRSDPRVGAFCDAFERERCAILGIAPPPVGLADLQLNLWRAKEQEREQARHWMEASEDAHSSPEEAEVQQGAARFEYLRCQWVTDLAQILLDAAVYSGPRGQD
jgi:hypothetical protein